MGWESVIGQDRVVETLRRALSRDRVAHAYLFHGPEGSGKRAAAIAFARALECERGGDAACDECGACGRSRRLLHPDIQVLLPQPADAKPEEVRERLDRLAAEPYATIDFVRRSSLDDPTNVSNRIVQYSVDRVHADLHRVLSFRSVEGRWKVAIVTDAELLRKEAANAFLKLLEEPTPRTVFVLTTSRAERLLPTIVSRCQQIRFERLSDEEISSVLVSRSGIDPAVALAISRMSDGSFSRALDLAESADLMTSRQEVVDFLRVAYQAWTHADSAAEAVERLARRGREYLKFLLSLTLVWLRDLLLWRHFGEEAPIVNVDQRAELARFAGGVPAARPEVLVALVEQAIELLDRNVNPKLVVSVLAQRLAEAMRGADAAKLVQPLAEA